MLQNHPRAAHFRQSASSSPGVLGRLQDQDLSVAIKAVELLVILVNASNVKIIKCIYVAPLHKYDQNWYLEIMIRVLEYTKSVGEDTVCYIFNTL